MAGLPYSIALLLEMIHSVLKLPDFAKDKKSASLLSRLESLASISDVIHDAEEKQPHDQHVKNWLRNVEDAVYDTEDLVDGILFEAARPKVEAKPRNLKSRALRFLPASIKRGPKRISIRKIVKAIDAIAKERGKFGFRNLEGDNDMPLSDSLPATSLLDEAAIYGREEDRINILHLLLGGDENLDAIALVGEGGLGKTTLAQLVCNDEKVSAHFELKAWVGVHTDFEVDRITRIILEAAFCIIIEGHMPLQLLLDKLSANLDGKKFLLVLDDVRNEDMSKWNALETSLKSGARGSKIIVTTRSQGVAACMGCSTRYDLNPLTEDSCWSLLAKSAFAGRDRSEIDMLEYIGRNILKTCCGIPLLVRLIGGLLRFKKTREEWCHVLEDLRKANNHDSISSIVLLSYYHLPALLKRCFAYCSLFPKDYEFDKEELVLLWMAEGFLQKSSGPSMEKVGAECFDGLLKRSFFIPVNNSHFKMHDCVHDLAKLVSQGACLRWESDTIKQTDLPKRIRHLSLPRSQQITTYKLSAIFDIERLRTFYLINSPSDRGYCHLSTEELEDFFPRLQRLRVLSLPHFQYAELPSSIGNLKYIHYLDVSHSALERLPESLCTLFYLQTLILTKCYSLLTLPQGIVKLVNLRKLDIKGAGLKQMPEEMSRLTSLQSLTNFIVGHGGSSIKELGALPDLHGSLSVSELQNVSSASDASEAKLKAKRYLDELKLEWSCYNEDPATDQKEVLENLKPSVELKKLSIRFYGGQEFPKWLGDSSFSKIISLHLSDCINCKSLPPLGRLSSLEHLIIERIGGIKSIGHEFYGVDASGCEPFQSLKTLKFVEMSQWEEWTLLEVDGEEFPCLEEFYVVNCPLLKGDLPKSLPTLVKLEICECEQLEVSLPQTSERCVKLDNCYKVQKKTQDKTLSKSEGEIASQFSSSMTEIPDKELQLEESRNNKNPAKEKAVQESGEPSGKLEEPSKSDGEITPEFSPSLIHQEQDHNQPTPSPSEDGNQQLMELPTDLHSLRIERYALDKLPKEILGRSSLQHLYIIDCISLETFPQSPSLKTLYIHNCKKLQFPQHQDAGLEDLCLGSSCDSLKIFPLNYFPKLKSLSLWDCRNLTHLSIAKGLQNELTSLDALEIKDCPNLRTFLEEEFQAPNLTSLVFFNCGSLKSLSGMQSLNSLQSLYINKCPALESLPVEGLPSGLIILCISFCDKITPQKGWKLDNLHSLSHFEIEGGCHELESFPEEGLLPSNLNSLRISRLLNLKFLKSEGLQKLTSLQTLEINFCNKLVSLPEHGLPSSLYSLSITDCSLLNPKLQNRKGREWFKIAHVPSIHLDEVSD